MGEMTNEEAIKQLGTWVYYMSPEFIPPMQVVEALRLAFDALRAGGTDTNVPTMPAGQPLTLEQLRGMKGKPAWIERNDEPHDGKWLIVEYADTENPDKTLYTREGTTYSDYGTYFTAYAYPPAHIDREAWTAEWEEDGECEHKMYRIKDPAKWKKYKCSKCGYKAGRRSGQKYCPSCGRAMKPEARAELEKRVRGLWREVSD